MPKNLTSTAGDYADLLHNLKERIRSAQIRASLSVNKELELKPVDDPAYDYQDDLKALEAMWLKKLNPFGERGYH